MTKEEKLKKQISDLEKKHEQVIEDIRYLLEMQITLKERFDDIHILNDEIEKLKRLQNNIIQQENTYKKAFNKMQNNIFAIITLFFGLFSFIAIDLNFTKSIFSYSTNTNINAFVLIVSFVLLQLMFFSFIYIFLLRPFLTEKPIKEFQAKTITISKWLYVVHLCLFFLSILISGCYIFDNYKLYKVKNPPVEKNADVSLHIKTSDDKKQQE